MFLGAIADTEGNDIVKGQQKSFYWRLYHGGVRLFAFLLMLGSLAAAIGIGVQDDSVMDVGLKWGLVALMILFFVLSALALRAPTRKI